MTVAGSASRAPRPKALESYLYQLCNPYTFRDAQSLRFSLANVKFKIEMASYTGGWEAEKVA